MRRLRLWLAMKILPDGLFVDKRGAAITDGTLTTSMNSKVIWPAVDGFWVYDESGMRIIGS